MASGRLAKAFPSATCYPVHYNDALEVLRPVYTSSLLQRTHQSLFLHLWNEMLNRANISKTMLPPQGCYSRQIADRHPVDGWGGEYAAEFLDLKISMESDIGQLREEIAGLKRRASESRSERAQLQKETRKIGKQVKAMDKHLRNRGKRKLRDRILAFIK